MMRLDLNTIDDITRKLTEAVPRELKNAGEDLQGRFRAVLESQLAKMDLVTREEFEIQKRVLERSREKLEQLEARLDAEDAS